MKWELSNGDLSSKKLDLPSGNYQVSMEPMLYSMAILDYDMIEKTNNGLGTSMKVPEQKDMISSNGKNDDSKHNSQKGNVSQHPLTHILFWQGHVGFVRLASVPPNSSQCSS